MFSKDLYVNLIFYKEKIINNYISLNWQYDGYWEILLC